MYSNSIKETNRVTATMRFRAWGGLLTIETRSWGVQQLIGMVRMAWDGLKLGNWFALFSWVFAICSLPLHASSLFFLVCICSLYILECIRVRVCIKYFPIMKIDPWFHPCTKSFQNKKIQSFCAHMEPCTIWSCLQLYNESNYA